MQHDSADDIAYFARDAGETRVLSLTTSLADTQDSDGALAPGRYLLQAAGLSAGKIAWVHFCPFAKGTASNPANPTAAGTQRIPLVQGVMQTFEVNVRKGYNDRISALTDSGTATLYVTRISRSL